MNTTSPASASKLLLTAAFCVLAVACSKKVKEVPPTDTGMPSTTEPATD